MERQHFIDQLKAVSIFLVVYGHNDGITAFNDFLTTFRIPLFFALSGYVSKDKSTLEFLPFITKMVKRLVIPYFIISSILYIIWFLKAWHQDFNCVFCNPVKNFIGIFYSQGGEAFMAWGVPMWFLTALFCVAVIDFFVSKFPLKIRFLIAVLLPFIGLFLQHNLRYKLPWSFTVAMVAYFFYFTGVVLRRINFIKFITGKEWLGIVTGLAIHLSLYRFNYPVDFFYGNFGSIPLLMINGLAGFLWVFSLFKLLPISNSITWIGRNTLPILSFHLLALGLVHWLAFEVIYPELSGNVLVFMLFSSIEILILIPVIMFLNRHLPMIVGLQVNPSTKLQPVKLEG